MSKVVDTFNELVAEFKELEVRNDSIPRVTKILELLHDMKTDVEKMQDCLIEASCFISDAQELINGEV